MSVAHSIRHALLSWSIPRPRRVGRSRFRRRSHSILCLAAPQQCTPGRAGVAVLASSRERLRQRRPPPWASWWRFPRILTACGDVTVGALPNRGPPGHSLNVAFVRSLRVAFAERELADLGSTSRSKQEASKIKQPMTSGRAAHSLHADVTGLRPASSGARRLHCAERRVPKTATGTCRDARRLPAKRRAHESTAAPKDDGC